MHRATPFAAFVPAVQAAANAWSTEVASQYGHEMSDANKATIAARLDRALLAPNMDAALDAFDAATRADHGQGCDRKPPPATAATRAAWRPMLQAAREAFKESARTPANLMAA